MSAINSGDADLDALIGDWINWNADGSHDARVVQDLVYAGDWDVLRKIMLHRLTFGTAGIRGAMGVG